MKFNRLYPRVLAAPLLAALMLVAASAQSTAVAVQSHKSYDQTVSSLKSAVSQGGMMVMATVDQGNMLSMAGLQLKATLFLVGNPTVGKALFEQDHAVGLYVPLRVFVYQGKDGHTYVSYDRPSALLAQFHNQAIDKTAAMLDQKLQGLVGMVTK